jgi:hypothetical protein
MKISEPLLSYLDTAMWSSSDINDENTQGNFDGFSVYDFPENERLKAQSDLDSFIKEASKLGIDCYLLGIEWVAHDFWLTRNYHGAGFWDGDYPDDIGEKLTALAHTYSEKYLHSVKISDEKWEIYFY